MKSRTSSCKKTAFRKDLTRFWPVWAGYCLFLVLLQVMISQDDLDYWYASSLADSLCVMGFVNLVYGLAVAQMLFGDLFNARMCSGVHALPLRREQWFGVHVRAGFLFSLIPTALMTAFSGAIILRHCQMVSSWQIPLYWFAGSNLQFVFFFALAVCCCLCAGNRFGATVIYGMANFFSILIYLLVDQLYTPLLKGVVTMSGPFELLCPVWQFVGNSCIEVTRLDTGRTYFDPYGNELQEFVGTFTLLKEGWIYAGILFAVGLILLVFARQMYKKRHLEYAGDFLAVRWMNPVFQVVFTVLCAAGFQGVFMVFFGMDDSSVYILPAVGLLFGWFAGRMFLERTSRVFRLKNILGFAAITAAMAGSLFLTHLDPLGIETWVPEPGNVKSASLRINYRNAYTTEDPEEIADLARLHKLALEQQVVVHPDYDDFLYNPRSRDPQAVQIILQYTAPNGWLSQREYYVSAEGESGDLVRKYSSRLDVVLAGQAVADADDLRHKMKDVTAVSVHGYTVPAEFVNDTFLNSLAEAIAADCEAGHLVQSGVFHPGCIIDLENSQDDLYYLALDLHGDEFWGSLYIYADCENVLAVLEPTGILETVRIDYGNAYG